MGDLFEAAVQFDLRLPELFCGFPRHGAGDAPVFTDGPYLETKEVIGGFWVIEAPDLDVALKLAAEGSKACGGKVEVRPFQGEG